MPTTHPKITFASQMCVISSCVWLFCVDILRSYYYWQSLALHAHHAPVWPGSDRCPIHALLEHTNHHCTSWEQLHPETSEKQTDNIVTNFFFPPWSGPSSPLPQTEDLRESVRPPQPTWVTRRSVWGNQREACCVCSAACHFFLFPFFVCFFLVLSFSLVVFFCRKLSFWWSYVVRE